MEEITYSDQPGFREIKVPVPERAEVELAAAGGDVDFEQLLVPQMQRFLVLLVFGWAVHLFLLEPLLLTIHLALGEPSVDYTRHFLWNDVFLASLNYIKETVLATETFFHWLYYFLRNKYYAWRPRRGYQVHVEDALAPGELDDDSQAEPPALEDLQVPPITDEDPLRDGAAHEMLEVSPPPPALPPPPDPSNTMPTPGSVPDMPLSTPRDDNLASFLDNVIGDNKPLSEKKTTTKPKGA